MKRILVVLAFAVPFGVSWAQSFQEKSTTAGQARLTVTNVGTFGNAFRGYRDGTGIPLVSSPRVQAPNTFLNPEFGLVESIKVAEFA